MTGPTTHTALPSERWLASVIRTLLFIVPAGSFLEFRLLPQKGQPGHMKMQRLWVPAGDEAAIRRALNELLVLNAARPSLLCFGINPRVRRGGKNTDVEAISVVAVDVDGKGLSLAEQKAKLARVVKQAPATLLVRSGTPGNLHLYWRIEPACAPERAAAVVRRLRLWLGADPSESPAKMMRLLGSYNWKTGQPEFVTGKLRERTCTIEQLAAALDACDVPVEPTKPKKQTRAAWRPPTPELEVQPLAPGRLDFFKRALPHWAKLLIINGAAGSERYPSRSEADAAVCRILVEAGASDDEILYFFAMTPRGTGQRFLERHAAGAGHDYLDRTISLIRDAVADEDEDTVLVKKARPMVGRLRVVLEMEVTTGDDKGVTIVQGVEATQSIWRHVFVSAGLEPAPLGAVNEAGRLRGRLLRVRLGSRGDGLQVVRWLPGRSEANQIVGS